MLSLLPQIACFRFYVRAVYENEIAEQNARDARQKAEAERATMLEGLARAEAQKAFAAHKLEHCRAAGAHDSGKVEIGFPKIKDETGFSWNRWLELDYKADDNANLSWSIGRGAGAQIPDLTAFAKTIC